MTKYYGLEYRGELSGLDARGSKLIFTTKHPEDQTTGIARYDLDKEKFSFTALDCGVTAQLLVDDMLWVAGTDGQLRRGTLGISLTEVGSPIEATISAMTATHSGVALIAGTELILVTEDGDEEARFDVGEPTRSLTSDESGKWIVVGTSRGQVCIFHEEDGSFVEGNRERLHDGEVTALAFAPDELRVYSTGTDCRLLISFVRGSLDTEDRGGKQMHDRVVQDILMRPDFESQEGTKKRFYTTGMDSSVKSWPRGRTGSKRPATHTDGVVQSKYLALVEFDEKTHLAVGGSDSSIRVFGLDDEGRVTDQAVYLSDAYARAEQLLQSQKPADRKRALGALGGYADERSLVVLSAHVTNREQDHKLQIHAVEQISTSWHPKAPEHLEKFFSHPASDVRVAAFEGLRKIRDDDDLGPLRLALNSGHQDLGVRAVTGLQELGNASAVELLVQTINHGVKAVRIAALRALESHHKKSPEGTLIGLRSTQIDVRQLATVRTYQRGLLDDLKVRAHLRKLWDDSDARVRQLAFLVATQRQPRLVKALRCVDEDYHRQIVELEEFDLPEEERSKDLPKAKEYSRKKLKEDDLRPLLEAMGSRSLDVCIRGARGLASLGDERSMGTLLQLSRESLTEARVAACESLQALGDPRSIKRLRMMLHDGSGSVRDAAFTALASLQPDDPLSVVDATFSAPEADIRERALRLLVSTIREGSADQDGLSGRARALLLRAINDGAPSIRQEAFKSILNLEVDGGGASTLRFIVQSTHADIRNEVLQEAKTRPDDKEYQAVLLETFDDPDPNNHNEAFSFAHDRWPSSEQEHVYKWGLSSKQLPLRIHTVGVLSNEKDPELRALLVEALDDIESSVRLGAVQALVRAENRELLAEALSSKHEDVRVEASAALAELGDDRALNGLLEIVGTWQQLRLDNAPQQDLDSRKPRLLSALNGLRDLGAPRSLDAVLELLEDEDAPIRHAAARALPWIAGPENLELLEDALRHSDTEVQAQAALAYAHNQDSVGSSHIFSSRSADEQLLAAFALREESQERFLAFVDNTRRAGPWSQALIFLLELAQFGGVPERCVALLSASPPKTRLLAAQAIENYGDLNQFAAWVTDTINSLGNQHADWDISSDTLNTISQALTFGKPRLALRAAYLLRNLSDSTTDRFEKEWAIFQDRYGGALTTLKEKADVHEPEPLSEGIASVWRRIKETAKSLVVDSGNFEEALTSLAMGAYVGLTREVAQYDSYLVRAAAVTGLANLASNHARFAQDTISVLLSTLSDPHEIVRERAFNALQTLNAPADVLSTQALTSGHSDMGFRGLQLLASGDEKDGTRLLKETMLESDNLYDQASRLLADRLGWIEVHKIGLAASSESFRLSCVRGLSRKFDVEDAAASGLKSALGAGHDDVRFLAAQELASKKEPIAFDTLVEMVESDDATTQRQGIRGLEALRDERAPTVLLDRIENDPQETALTDALFASLGRSGDVSITDRLLKWIDADKYRSKSAHVALQLSGYKQYEWAKDEEVTEEWEESLEPRHPALFEDLLSLAYRLADPNMLSDLVPLSKWPPESEKLDATLAPLLRYSDDNIRHNAVEMVSWRLRHRNGPAQGLVNVLSSGDVLDQFYAAEGLALHGRDEGLPVLRTAVDVIDDYTLRNRAVLAIGSLAHPSTVDMILAIADDDEHYLQPAAAEAIGHMSKSERSDEIFGILKRLLNNSGYDKTVAALKGLRWFGTPGAWDVLRQQALSDNWWVVREAVQLLRFDKDSRDVLAQVLRNTHYYENAQYAAQSLRHSYGPESLEPDYLLMQANQSGLEQIDALERLRERGEPSRILEILPRVQDHNEDEFVGPLVGILLSRDPLPVAEAAPMVSSDKSRTASVAAQILGRAGKKAGAKYADDLISALQTTRKRWQKELADVLANRADSPARLEELTTTYRWLVWAAGQLEVGVEELVAAARLQDRRATPIREEAISTLGDAWLGDDGESLLKELATGSDARIRAMAAAELHRANPAAGETLLAKSMGDDVSVTRLTNKATADDVRETFLGALADDNVAGIALPKMAAMGDVKGLYVAMRDSKLKEDIRLGAIDALGTIETDDVADLLARFGADEEQDEMLRKAAWRARRRIRRAVTQAGGTRG